MGTRKAVWILAALLAAPLAASASHPSIVPAEAVVDRGETFTLAVPVTGPLQHVHLTVPVDSAKRPLFEVEFVERPAGWSAETRKAGERIVEINWTPPAGAHKAGDLVLLRFHAKSPPTPGVYEFNAVPHLAEAASEGGHKEEHAEAKTEEGAKVRVVDQSSLDSRIGQLESQVGQARARADQAAASAGSLLPLVATLLALLALVVAAAGMARKR
jgi:uncharacterized protein YcnI